MGYFWYVWIIFLMFVQAASKLILGLMIIHLSLAISFWTRRANSKVNPGSTRKKVIPPGFYDRKWETDVGHFLVYSLSFDVWFPLPGGYILGLRKAGAYNS